ncbi:MAG TPA: hypothetical protein VK139_07260 [Microbacteriaceae bacterium]|nr:hypothetical protein [Microbacteriaceae bacterium]
MTISTITTGTVVEHLTVSAKAVTTTLWRVSGRDDRVLGHVRLVDSKHGERYAATLILPGGVRTMFLGEFWSLSDALDCFI